MEDTKRFATKTTKYASLIFVAMDLIPQALQTLEFFEGFTPQYTLELSLIGALLLAVYDYLKVKTKK